MGAGLSEVFLTEKVSTFASVLSTLDTFWKIVNILTTIGIGLSIFIGDMSIFIDNGYGQNGGGSTLEGLLLFVTMFGIFILYKIIDFIRVFSLGIGWVLLSINENLENKQI